MKSPSFYIKITVVGLQSSGKVFGNRQREGFVLILQSDGSGTQIIVFKDLSEELPFSEPAMVQNLDGSGIQSYQPQEATLFELATSIFRMGLSVWVFFPYWR